MYKTLQPGTYVSDAAGTPNYRALVQLGYQAHSMYVGGNFGVGRRNIEMAWEAGLSTPLNFEREPGAALGGYRKGQQHALTAMAQCHDDLGWDWDCPIIFSGTDTDVQPFQYPTCDDYYRACIEVFGPEYCGAYGGRRYIEHLETWVPDGFILWQAGGWRYGFDSPTMHMKQYVGFPRGNVNQVGNTPDPRIGCLIDENKVYRPIRAWSGYGKEHYTPDKTQTGGSPVLHLIYVNGADAVFRGFLDSATQAFEVEWINGELERHYKEDKIPTFRGEVASLYFCSIVGGTKGLPRGDSQHNWTGAEFYNTREGLG